MGQSQGVVEISLDIRLWAPIAISRASRGCIIEYRLLCTDVTTAKNHTFRCCPAQTLQ
jgi:hypothetical protein